MNINPSHISQFIIAAPNSNAGKTTITLGLLRLFQEKGISVQPFKVGSDYIDPKFHQQACGKIGVNLDLFMMSEEHIRNQLMNFGNDQQVNCIEGVMGLFDGAKKAEGSTAELAIKINIPVILVVDAKAVAYSVAPLIQGFKTFDKKLHLIGVIFNRVASKSHYSFLKDACNDVGVKSFGYLRKLENAHIPSRHLGLNIENLQQFDETISTIATEMKDTLDWQSLLKETTSQKLSAKKSINQSNNKELRFAVAKDEAFNFIYPQNLKAMEDLGSLIFFSPIRDTELPQSNFVYFPGGYPECYLKELTENTSMLNSVNTYIQNGGKVFAECGGMMYLGKSISDKEGNTFLMANVFDFSTTMENAKIHLGYREIVMDNLKLKGHEFHYSVFTEQSETPYKATVLNAKGLKVETDIFVKKKAMASYIHHYFAEKNLLINLINKLETL